MRTAVLLLAVFTASSVAAPARADEPAAGASESGAKWGLGVGVVLAVVPAATGAALFSTSDTIEPKRAGIYSLCGGLALAPVVSHLMAREWARAGIFGALPMASFIGMLALVQLRPAVLLEGDVPTRVTFAILISVEVLSSTAGLADSLGGVERVRARRRPALVPVPLVGPHTAGLSLGGVF